MATCCWRTGGSSWRSRRTARRSAGRHAFRGERSFNLEVTRPRRAEDAAGVGGPLLAKIRQLPPSVPNAVLLAVECGEAERWTWPRLSAPPGSSRCKGRDVLRDAWIQGNPRVLRALPAARRRRWCGRRRRSATPARRPGRTGRRASRYPSGPCERASSAFAPVEAVRSGSGSGPSRYRSRR